jgi:HPt (histidine-containing phosphotransfer) domain-containing protein
MHQAIDMQDFDALRKIAHKVKSSSANVGALRLSRFAYTIEAKPSAQDIGQRFSSLIDEYRRVHTMLSDIVTRDTA